MPQPPDPAPHGDQDAIDDRDDLDDRGAIDDRDDIDDLIAQWRQERPDLAPALAAMGTAGRLARVHALAERRVEAVFARHGLQRGEFDVLAALRRAGAPHALTPSQLAAALMLSRAGMTSRLDRLESAGLVERRLDPADRRSLRVLLTDRGRAVADAAVTEHAANEAALLAPLTPAQLAALDDALRVLLASLGRSEGPRSEGPAPGGPSARA